MSAEFIDNCEPWAILHDYYHGEALFTPEAGDEFLAVRKHPLDPATFMKHLKRIRSLIARLQNQQDAEDSRCEKTKSSTTTTTTLQFSTSPLQLSPEERKNTVQAKIHSNANIDPKITTPEDCAKPHRALNGLRTQEETAPPISQKGTKSPSRRENSKTASHHAVAPANVPTGLAQPPRDSPPSIESKPVLRSLSPLTTKQTSAPRLVNIDLNGKKSPTTQENKDQDGWNVIDATEDGYAAVEMEHVGDMEGRIELEHGDDGGDWDLCE
ncbi:MAG: hypothetical protein LQ339_006828 [Xanthoria mediterranea]|nr:MAG: hypothetical protein LQ339_006828 [Xanthoria mediterranea]